MVTRLKTIYPDTEQLRELIRPTFHNILSVASGIIYLSQYPRDLTGIFPKTSIPVVIAFGISKDAIPCVNYDDAHGAYLATEHLIQAGCRRIAMISGPINSISMTKRLSGYTRALLDGGIDFDPKLIQLSDWMEDSGFRGNLFSAGASFTIDFERLFWLRFPFSVGITYSYSGGTAFDTLLSAVRADGAGFGHHYVGPVFSVDF